MIEEKLREANAAVRASTRDVAPMVPVEATSGRVPLILVSAILTAAVIGMALFAQQRSGEEAATAPVADSTASTTTTEAATTTEAIAEVAEAETNTTADTLPPDTDTLHGGVAAYVTDGAPADLALVNTQSAADFDQPLTVIKSLVYGPADVTAPSGDDDVVFVSWSAGEASELFGEPISVRGSEGVNQTFAIGFHEAGYNVWVSSLVVPNAELPLIAEGLQIDADGVATTESLRDLQLRHASESHFYTAEGATVPPGGHTASYGNGLRSFQIFVEPFDGDEASVAWSIGAATELQVGSRTVLMQTSETGFGTSISAVWIEGDAVISVLAVELSEPEVVAVIEGIRPANPSEW